MVLNVLIKNENSNIYGTGGQRVKCHCSHRLSGVELLYCKVEFRILWDTCTICWPNAPAPFTLLRHQVNCCTVVAWPCYALCAESDLKPVYLSRSLLSLTRRIWPAARDKLFVTENIQTALKTSEDYIMTRSMCMQQIELPLTRSIKPDGGPTLNQRFHQLHFFILLLNTKMHVMHKCHV